MSNVTTIQNIKYNQNLEFWSARVAACHASGLTVSEWCKANCISKATYYKWQRIVLAKAGDLQELHVVKAQETEFIEVSHPSMYLEEPKNNLVANIELKSASLQLFSDISPELVIAICKGLK